ncbi:MAG: Precorrin-3B methylase [Prochlorothrix sp.]
MGAVATGAATGAAAIGTDQPALQGQALVKEVCRRIRVARSYWDAHNNRACRQEREKALALYNQLSKDQKEQIPQVLRVWLRYRSEKYFGAHRTPPGSGRSKSGRSKSGRAKADRPKSSQPQSNQAKADR